MKIELVSGWAISGTRHWLVTLQIVLGSIVYGVSELEVAIKGAVGPGDGTAAMERPSLVKHHLLSSSLSDFLRSGARFQCRLLGRVTFIQLVRMQLEDVDGSGHNADALVARPAAVRRLQDEILAQSSMALAP